MSDGFKRVIRALRKAGAKPDCKHDWQGFIDTSRQVKGAYPLYSKCRKCGAVVPHGR